MYGKRQAAPPHLQMDCKRISVDSDVWNIQFSVLCKICIIVSDSLFIAELLLCIMAFVFLDILLKGA